NAITIDQVIEIFIYPFIDSLGDLVVGYIKFIGELLKRELGFLINFLAFHHIGQSLKYLINSISRQFGFDESGFTHYLMTNFSYLLHFLLHLLFTHLGLHLPKGMLRYPLVCREINIWRPDCHIDEQ